MGNENGDRGEYEGEKVTDKCVRAREVVLIDGKEDRKVNQRMSERVKSPRGYVYPSPRRSLAEICSRDGRWPQGETVPRVDVRELGQRIYCRGHRARGRRARADVSHEIGVFRQSSARLPFRQRLHPLGRLVWAIVAVSCRVISRSVVEAICTRVLGLMRTLALTLPSSYALCSFTSCPL